MYACRTVRPLTLASHRAGQVALTRNVAMQKSLDLTGIFPPIPTPFTADENIAFAELSRNLEKWNQFPFKGYVVQGSNGEYAYLSDQERVEVVRQVKQMIGQESSKLLLAGSGCESTRATIRLSQQMAEAGADAVLVVTPCYYKGQMNDAAMVSHFRAVADNSPVPVILYSVPANTGVDLSPEAVRILSVHPNIIGLKDSGGDVAKMGRIVNETRGQNFQVLAGSAGFLLPAYTVGCVGGVCALANVLGKEVCDLHSLFHNANGNLGQEVVDLQHRLILPNAMVTRRFGVPGLKASMEWFGFYGGPTRAPLLKLGDKEQLLIRQSFVDSGFL